MKTALPRFAALALAAYSLALSSLQAAEDPRLAELESADDKRTAAMKSVDRAALAAILSDELHYAHSTGVLDTKASLTETLVSGRSKYLSFNYEQRRFTFPAAEIALMSGRVKIRTINSAGDAENTLIFLGAWRKEQGQWRFLAWQSCKLPPPDVK